MGMLMDRRKVCVVLGLVVTMTMATERASACSVAMCLGGGMEVAQTFSVQVRLDRKPLADVRVEIHSSNLDVPLFSGQTDAKGRLRVEALKPGEYWIRVTYLNIEAGYHCFHVSKTASLRAKYGLRYEWGDWGIPLRSVAGVVREWRLGSGESPLWNLVHSTHAPIAGASLSLRAALSGRTWQTTSADNGEFAFPQVPDGAYVLHVEGRSKGDPYEPRDLALAVSSSSKRDRLTLTRQETGCGNVTLNPESK
jgi:hypothetical protein